MKQAFLMVPLTTLLLAHAAAAQSPRTAAKVQVTVVEIPVTVLDRSGNPLRGLTRENFELYDDGRKRPIEYFDTVDFSPAGKSPVESTAAPSRRRNFMLLFDLTNSMPADLKRTRDAALSFVRQQLLPRDVVSVATLSVEGGVQLLTAFTTDRKLVARAIETFGHPRMFRPADPLLISMAQPPMSTEGGAEGGGTAEPTALIRAHFEDIARGGTRANDDLERQRIMQQVRSLASLARTLDRVPGQKQILLLSPGFDAQLVHGRESLSSEESQADAAASVEGEVWKVDNDKRFGSSTATTQIKEMGSIFKRSDVVLHALDIRGVRSNVDLREGVKASSNEALHLLTEPTGGAVFKNSNDIGEHFGSVLRRQEHVYVLGFRSTATTSPGKLHEVKVKLVNVPSARVSHRSGYYETSAQQSPLEKILVVSDALMTEPKNGAIGVSALSVAFSAGASAQVPVVIEIDGPTLLESAAGRTALAADIFVYVFDDTSVVKDFLHQALTLDLAKTSGALASGGLKLYGTLSVDPGSYVVKAVVATANGAFGYTETPLMVHDFREPAVLPPVCYDESGSWIMVKAPGRTAAEYPFQVAGESFVPAARPLLKNGTTYKMALFTYHMPGESLQLSARVRAPAGGVHPATVSFAGRTTPDASGATKYLLHFAPVGLPPGQYILELTVSSKAGPIVRSMKFTV